MIWRLLSNNWYLVLVNGQSNGFFKSSRGVKQGDPPSPTLFILVAEVLARSLNTLHQDLQFKGYGLPKWSPQINHLSYVDDTILFCSGENKSLKKMLRILRRYEKASGQISNTDKSNFYLHHKIDNFTVNRIQNVLGMRKGSFPFT